MDFKKEIDKLLNKHLDKEQLDAVNIYRNKYEKEKEFLELIDVLAEFFEDVDGVFSWRIYGGYDDEKNFMDEKEAMKEISAYHFVFIIFAIVYVDYKKLDCKIGNMFDYHEDSFYCHIFRKFCAKHSNHRALDYIRNYKDQIWSQKKEEISNQTLLFMYLHLQGLGYLDYLVEMGLKDQKTISNTKFLDYEESETNEMLLNAFDYYKDPFLGPYESNEKDLSLDEVEDRESFVNTLIAIYNFLQKDKAEDGADDGDKKNKLLQGYYKQKYLD